MGQRQQKESSNSNYLFLDSLQENQSETKQASKMVLPFYSMKKMQETLKIDFYLSLEAIEAPNVPAPNSTDAPTNGGSNSTSDSTQATYNGCDFDLCFYVVQKPDIPLFFKRERVVESVKIVSMQNNTNVPFSFSIDNLIHEINLNQIIDFWSQGIADMNGVATTESMDLNLFLVEISNNISHSGLWKTLKINFEQNQFSCLKNCYAYHRLDKESNMMMTNIVQSYFLENKVHLLDFFSCVKTDTSNIYLPLQAKITKFMIDHWGASGFIPGKLPQNSIQKKPSNLNLQAKQPQNILPKIDFKEEQPKCMLVSVPYNMISKYLDLPQETSYVNPDVKIPCVSMAKKTYVEIIKKICSFYSIERVIPTKCPKDLDYSIIVEPIYKETLKHYLLSQIQQCKHMLNYQFHFGSVIIEIEGFVKTDK